MTMDAIPKINGININLVSAAKLEKMATTEKVQFILEEVVAGKILVLERGLTSKEEAKLIEETMRAVDPDTFIGIEMQSYGVEPARGWGRLMAKTRAGRPRMAVIGPADKLRTIHKDSQEIRAMVVAPEGVVESAEA
jgi:uncharacterized protein